MVRWAAVLLLVSAVLGCGRRRKAAPPSDASVRARTPLPAPRAHEPEPTWVYPSPGPELPLVGDRAARDQFGYTRAYLDRVAVAALLRAGRFTELTAHLEKLQSDFEADYRDEYLIYDAAHAFDDASPEVGERLEQWLAQSPDSFAPWLARGFHRAGLGALARGTRVSAETSAAQVSAMRGHYREATSDLTHALELRPGLVVAYGQLMVTVGGGVPRDGLLRQALERCPECFLVRLVYLRMTTPRWGGSYDLMQEAITEAARHSNPRLAVLAGMIDWDRCRTATENDDLAAALATCDAALARGPLGDYFKSKALVLELQDQRESALALLDRAAALRPQDVDALASRGGLRVELGSLRAGTRDLTTAWLLDRKEPAVVRAIPYAVQGWIRQAYNHQGEPATALADVDQALALDAASAEAHYYRAHILRAAGQPEQAPAELATACRLGLPQACPDGG